MNFKWSMWKQNSFIKRELKNILYSSENFKNFKIEESR